MTIKIGPYSFRQARMICPEEYYVFDEDGKQVAYVHLRYGYLTAKCPDVGGVPIYCADLLDASGGFGSAERRIHYLCEVAQWIRDFYERERGISDEVPS